MGSSYTYSTGDVSVGDMDGDGEYEYVVKWDPSNQKDNSQIGYTGPVLLDAYRLNGQRLWRIDLGRNIRAGAHYTQFQVFDYDGDGRAEVAVKTGDGSVSGTGQVIGNASADHRNSDGHVITGPEYLTVFDGLTGAVRATASFQPARGNVTDWGDNYGNRSERYLAGTAYLDGQRPSIVMGRGYYALSKIAAWDFRNGALSLRWMFDSNVAGSSWEGRGAHSLSVTDVDGNGSQEIVYGGMTINSNGTGRYTTSYYAHGDALHVGDFVPSRPGKEIWQIHEQTSGNSASLRDASSGAFIMTKQNTCNCEGPGRGVAGDVYAGNAGAEFWGSGTGLTNLFSSTGASVGRTPGSVELPRLVGRRPGAGAAGRQPRRQVRHGQRHAAAHRRRRQLDQRHQGHAEPVRGRPGRLARGGALPLERQPLPPHLHDDRAGDEPLLHVHARPAVPGRDRPPEHGLQPAAAPQLLRGQRHERAAHAQHHVPGHAAGNADATRRKRRSSAAARARRAPTAASWAAATSTSRPTGGFLEFRNVDGGHRRHAHAALPRGAGRRQHAARDGWS